MSVKKIILLFLLGYFLAIAQTSFFSHFEFFGLTLNLIFIAVAIFCLSEKNESTEGIYFAMAGGFFLDIFSARFFGFETIIALSIALFIKYIINRYVRIPIFKKN